MKTSYFNQEFDQEVLYTNVLEPQIIDLLCDENYTYANIIEMKDKFGNSFFVEICAYLNKIRATAFTIGFTNNKWVHRNLGFIDCRFYNNENQNYLEVESLLVTESLRKLHIGTQLLNVVYELAKNNDCQAITLNSLPESVKFYKKYGFTTKNHISENNWLHSIEMVLPIEKTKSENGELTH